MTDDNARPDWHEINERFNVFSAFFFNHLVIVINNGIR